MYTYVLLAIVTCCTAGSHAFYSSNSNGRSQPPICQLPSKPCRMQVTVHSLNGTLTSEMSTQICTCSQPYRCSEDWSRANHVISRNLLSSTHNMTLNMMFCQPIQPQRSCTIGEEALVVSGSLTIPYNVVSFNCRCSDSAPLLLSQRQQGYDYLIYHSYVCSNHMPTCPRRISYCAANQAHGISYSCKCPRGTRCQVPEGSIDPVGFLYCRP